LPSTGIGQICSATFQCFGREIGTVPTGSFGGTNLCTS